MLLGLGSIIGTGVFVSLALAVDLAGSAVVWSVAVAALVALCNGLATAQLASARPVSGGTYEYGYVYLHPAAGFTAGWLFLIAKSASAGTAALGIAAYLGQGTSRLLGLVAVAMVTLLVLAGIRRSNQANAVVVGLATASLAAVVAAAWPAAVDRPVAGLADAAGGDGVLEAAALVFVAFTGYGRVATLGEEVRSPRRTIPIAVVATLLATAVIYGAVAWVESRLFPVAPRSSGAVLIVIAEEVGGSGLAWLVRVGGLAALVGVLINLVLGLSRVALAMGRRHDLPPAFARIDRQGRTPTVAVLGVALMIGAFALVGDIGTTWSFSALTVLVYYALTNLAALRMPPGERWLSPAVPVIGLVGCLGLAVFIEPVMWLWGLGLVVVGLGWHLFRRRSGQKVGES